jgi:hypothetical protein
MSQANSITDDGLAPNLLRRSALKALAVATQLAFLSPMGALAQTPGSASSALSMLPLPADAATFMALSKALTGHASMDATFGARLFTTLSASDASFAQRAAALARQVEAGQTPQQLLALANAAGLRDTALVIVTGWYTGTVTRDHHSKMVAYADSLMYATVADGLSVPTYCSNGPLWWEKQPPAAGVSTPAEAARARLAASASATKKQA